MCWAGEETFLLKAESPRRAADIFAEYMLEQERKLYGFEYAKMLAKKKILVIGDGSSQLFSCCEPVLRMTTVVMPATSVDS